MVLEGGRTDFQPGKVLASSDILSASLAYACRPTATTTRCFFAPFLVEVDSWGGGAGKSSGLVSFLGARGGPLVRRRIRSFDHAARLLSASYYVGRMRVCVGVYFWGWGFVYEKRGIGPCLGAA